MAMIQFESSSLPFFQYNNIDPLFFWFIIISLGISLDLCFCISYPE